MNDLKYIKANLGTDEKILVSEGICKGLQWYFSGMCTLIAILMFIRQAGEPYDKKYTYAGIVCLIYAVVMWFKHKAVEMAVTNKKVILKKGLFLHNTAELRLEKVESVSIKKNFLGQILGFATIVFTGTGSQKIEFLGIANAQKIKNEIDDIFSEYEKSKK